MVTFRKQWRALLPADREILRMLSEAFRTCIVVQRESA